MKEKAQTHNNGGVDVNPVTQPTSRNYNNGSLQEPPVPGSVTIKIASHPFSVHAKQHRAGCHKYYATQDKWKYIIKAQTRNMSPPVYQKGTPLLATVVFICKPKSFAGFDIDNYLDLIFDAAEGFVYENDKQITKLVAEKIRGEDNATIVRFTPRT